MNNKNFAIFASGNGSNAEVLCRYALKYNYPLKFVFSDKKDAGVLSRMDKLGVEHFSIEKNKMSKIDYERHILDTLKEKDIKWIFLAGYMKILSSSFLNEFYDPNLKLNRVVNIHPSLLPSFPGKNGYGDAFDYGVKVSGVTVHFVDDGIDTGPILLQESFVRDSNDTLESFKTKGLELEHLIYPKALDMIMNDQIEVYTR